MIFNRPESQRMLRQRILFSMCVWLASSLLPASCRAEFFYSLGFGQAAYSGSAGESVQIDIYIRELVTNGSIPRFAVGNNDGLFSIGATINYSADFGAPAAIESSSDIVFAPSFDGVDVVATPSQNKFELTSFLTPSTLPYLETTADPTNPNLYSILIGTVTFKMSPTLGNTTTISIGKRELAGLGAIDNNLVFELTPGFFEQRNIDDIIQGSTATLLNIAVVPEPAFLWLASVPLLLKRVRSSKRRST